MTIKCTVTFKSKKNLPDDLEHLANVKQLVNFDDYKYLLSKGYVLKNESKSNFEKYFAFDKEGNKYLTSLSERTQKIEEGVWFTEKQNVKKVKKPKQIIKND